MNRYLAIHDVGSFEQHPDWIGRNHKVATGCESSSYPWKRWQKNDYPDRGSIIVVGRAGTADVIQPLCGRWESGPPSTGRPSEGPTRGYLIETTPVARGDTHRLGYFRCAQRVLRRHAATSVTDENG